MSDDALIDEIARLLAEAAPARSKISLFGSRARGEHGAHSDLDVLVIEPSVADPIQESVRLRRALDGLGVPIDVLVVAEPEAARLRLSVEPSWSEPSGRGGSSLIPEESEEAGRLLAAACADLRAATALSADPDQANEVIGFHAQQAVETAIKTVLLASSLEIPRTHDVGLLLRILAERKISAPESVANGDWLTPWTVVARYGAADNFARPRRGDQSGQ